MEELRRLVKIFNENKFDKIYSISLLEEDSQESRLFKLASSKKNLTDKEVEEKLYFADAGSSAYRMLKSRLKKKLYKSLHLLDMQKRFLNESFHDEKDLHEQLLTVRILVNVGEFTLAEKTANQVLARAKKQGYVQITVFALERLVGIAVHDSSLAKLDLYERELEHYRELYKLEDKARSLYLRARLILNSKVEERSRYINNVPSIIEELKLVWQTTGSSKSFAYYVRINFFYLECIGAFNAIVEAVEEINTLVSKGVVDANSYSEQYIRFIYLYACLRVNRFTEGLESAEKFEALIPEENINWFAYKENHFLLAVHSRNYKLAIKILNQVSTNDAYQRIGQVFKEKWSVFKRAATFIFGVDEDISNLPFDDVRVEEPLSLSKDKQGFNVFLIVLDFIEKLKGKEYEALFKLEERLQKYILVHFKSPETERNKLLLRLLLTTIREEFDATKVRKKGAMLFQKLQATPVPGDAYAEVEIIPFEHLWEFILALLPVGTKSTVKQK
ncbi:hypothetical protein [Pontibacter harenae]|uniref:hypothetical protein n=1 Tax=Pontibacter harenae TaxID=2894083 RepID=UPI001E527A21|nr:hypothetical protein [Pontibacter harenae]MCC9167937.1 hypothetical protein [Pontibacter harenae]